MSLETLRALRLSGAKPASVVKVVVGARPAIEDRPDLIVVTDRPERMDWRPVIGLPLVMLVTDAALDLGERAFDCAVAAGCLPEGVAFRDGAHSTDEATKPTLQRMWELLCIS